MIRLLSAISTACIEHQPRSRVVVAHYLTVPLLFPVPRLDVLFELSAHPPFPFRYRCESGEGCLKKHCRSLLDLDGSLFPIETDAQSGGMVHKVKVMRLLWKSSSIRLDINAIRSLNNYI